MSSLLCSLFDALELEPDAEEPALRVDDDVIVYFDESAQGLEMICPLGELPATTDRLQQVLRMNYIGPVILAADSDAVVLLALIRMPNDSSGAELLTALESLILAARGVRRELNLVQ
ncbi:Type III secretion chaperone domain-containing protein [Pseudomonas sp. LAMO17WK12:I10]|uniref:hypothetical protein n=1 Tax=unclassified Pseudomonas TaxID=196821 RepID=UPI000BCEB90C|nr:MULTISPECIES: hypothetical protein [unclassified Pseudomonas]PXX54014.1 type III secretion system (T3SS) chaperone-like protein [Pseudomonas sp. LAMO17WK12:I9]SNY51960.1 Type III secretion chaperone domain-containing protein [Pseudomonas sp. LAMO17WK12:I10]